MEKKAAAKARAENAAEQRAAVEAKVLNGAATPEVWTSGVSLQVKFGDHGSDFGAESPRQYIEMAAEFRDETIEMNYETKIRGTKLEIFDPYTGTYGSYSLSDGTPINFFKPDDPLKYWDTE